MSSGRRLPLGIVKIAADLGAGHLHITLAPLLSQGHAFYRSVD